MFDRTTFLGVLAGALGGAIAIAIMEAFSIRENSPSGRSPLPRQLSRFSARPRPSRLNRAR